MPFITHQIFHWYVTSYLFCYNISYGILSFAISSDISLVIRLICHKVLHWLCYQLCYLQLYLIYILFHHFWPCYMLWLWILTWLCNWSISLSHNKIALVMVIANYFIANVNSQSWACQRLWRLTLVMPLAGKEYILNIVPQILSEVGIILRRASITRI